MPARCQEVDNTHTCVQQWWRDRGSHRCSKCVTGQGGSVSTFEWHKWAGQGSTKAMMNREQWHGTYGHRSLSHFFVFYYRMVNIHCFHVFPILNSPLQSGSPHPQKLLFSKPAMGQAQLSILSLTPQHSVWTSLLCQITSTTIAFSPIGFKYTDGSPI